MGKGSGQKRGDPDLGTVHVLVRANGKQDQPRLSLTLYGPGVRSSPGLSRPTFQRQTK